jgi:hypothetical protein
VPYIIRPRQMQRMVAGAFAAVMLIVLAPAAAHAAACPKSATSHPFSAVGDNANYALVPGSAFEGSAPGWSLNGAEVAEESGEGENQNGQYSEDPQASGSADPSHVHSLHVKSHGQAVSPAFCVSSEYPTYRLYYKKQKGGPNATLNIALRYTDSSGQHEVPGDALEGEHHVWTLSPVLDLASKLPVATPGSSVTVRFVFTGSGKSAWAIDEVYIDPYSR